MEQKNIFDFDAESAWIRSLIAQRKLDSRMKLTEMLTAHPAPTLNNHAALSDFLTNNRIEDAGRILVSTALLAHTDPDALIEMALDKNPARLALSAHDFPLPTGETVLWLLAGKDPNERVKYHPLFETSHIFYKQSVIELSAAERGDSPYSGVLSLTRTFRDLFLYSEFRPPRFSNDFPAHLLSTSLSWDDLILVPGTAAALEDVKVTLRHHKRLSEEWGMRSIMRPGCRVLLYGDSGQGKTLTAALLGKFLERPVYRLDISAVASKYIGETNQRLESLFSTAENKDWIIFIDEGDALIGKRSEGAESPTAHYANQEVAYLLQRIESFNGIIIVATNLRTNIDLAFQRRFDVSVLYKALDHAHQLKVWERFWPSSHLDHPANLEAITKNHHLSPASIINVIRRIAVHMAERDERVVPAQMLQQFAMDEEYKYKGQHQAFGR